MRIIIEKYGDEYTLIDTTGILKLWLTIWGYIKKPIKFICLFKGHNTEIIKDVFLDEPKGKYDWHLCLRCGYSRTKVMITYMPRHA